MENISYLIIACACLFSGLLIHFISLKIEFKYFYSTVIVSWLLIALCPVFMIFPFFPDSKVNGEIFNFSFGGALAAFVFIWWFGAKKSILSVSIDKLRNENEELREKNYFLSTNKSLVNKEKVLTKTEKFLYTIKGTKDKKIGIITGAISNIKGIDVWVNSENTNMQMARFYESSISAVIRYLGAEKDKFGKVTNDILIKLLENELDGNLYVNPTTVIATSAGKLTQSHKVKKILHVASVQGEIGAGYKPIHNIQDCIKNVLEKMDASEEKLESVLFPLLGTGTAKGDLTETISILFDITTNYFDLNKTSKIKEVLFLAYTDIQLNKCLLALNDNKKLNKFVK
jgi:O-acetyl-ADP-ribose deacetylase (regulator of RNase III)